MKYIVLNSSDTDIWITNVQKTLKITYKVLTYYKEQVNKRKSEVIQYYHRTPWSTFWSKFLYNLYTEDDIIVGMYSGNLNTLSLCSIDERFKMSQAELDLRDLSDSMIKNGDIDFVICTNRAWSNYAETPFQITEDDITNHGRIQKIHKLCKTMLEAVGEYDEALDLVEDSLCRS